MLACAMGEGAGAQRLHLGCSPHCNMETSGSLSLGSRMNEDVVTKLVRNKAVCLFALFWALT